MKNFIILKRTVILVSAILISLSFCPEQAEPGAYTGSTLWYLAEGTTKNDFSEWILIQNPNNSAAQVQVTFMKDDGSTLIQNIEVGATSRYTINVNTVTDDNEDLAFINEDVSVKVESTNSVGIIVERSMYRTSGGIEWACGLVSIGATSTNTLWYLAEGTTKNDFSEWILIQNPNDSAAQVQVTYMKDDGSTLVKTMEVGATSRYTINVNAVTDANENLAFVDEDVSAEIESTNDIGIIVERSMYRTSGGIDWVCGTATIGATKTSTTWYFAEGATLYDFDEYICIQNPNASSAQVTVTFMKSNGDTVEEEITIGATSRSTIYVNSIVPDESLSTKVESDIGVIAERAMYRSSSGIDWACGHASIGVMGTQTTWFLAEGATVNDFSEYICIQNPNSSSAEVLVTFMKSDGTTEEEEITIDGTSRYTILANDFVPNESISTKVESTNNKGIIVERAMYRTSGGIGWVCGHAIKGAKEKVITVQTLGDSVTYGSPYGGTSNTYPEQMDALFEAQYGVDSYNVINRGVAGYRADEVLNDMVEEGWLTTDNPDFVLLMVGGNDLNQEIILFPSNITEVINQTTEEVQDIIDVINAHTNRNGNSPTIIVSTFIPNNKEGIGGTVVVALYNTSLQDNLTGTDLIITTNWDDIKDPDALQADTDLMADDSHPNVEGYAIMAENWYDAIETF